MSISDLIAQRDQLDAATGTTWSGRGRAPTWFDAARIAEFTI